MTTEDWLFVIDIQPAFSDPASPWFCAALDAAKANIARLLPAYGDRVLFSRFVPPEQVFGAWIEYYDTWAFALPPEAKPLWSVDEPWGHYPSMQSHTLSKWVPAAKQMLPEDATIALCGVSTDCCVMSTALAAIDDGRRVRLIEDACAAGSEEIQRQSVELMRLRAPMLTVTDTQKELARAGAGAV
ncbi:putative hydrolase (plasmid) [Paracoccaceae bacterium]|nr:putative hydrolase [Paracoccaceae bacterium]